MRKSIMYYVLCIMLFSILLTPSAYAATHKPCDPTDAITIAKFGPCPAGLTEIEQVFTSIITTVVGLGFIACLVMLVLGGIKYLTSGGEPKAIQAAHFTVTWALLGVLFLAIAWLILQLIQAFTGVNVTVFDIRKLCGDAPTFPWCSK